jgi:hypothetical protein
LGLLPAQTLAQSPSAAEAQVTVRARPRPRETFRRELVPEELRRMAGTRGDALLATQNLPGMGRPTFGLGAFIIRSSDPEDSLVTLEGHPMVLPFHFYGLASTGATDLLDRVEYLPGNFSARYGRVAGGVIDVTLRSPARDRWRASADVDVIDAGVFGAAPLGRRATVAVGARRSWVDAVLGLFLPSDGPTRFTRLPVYWDYQSVAELDLGATDDARVVVAGTDDRLQLQLARPDPRDPRRTGLASHLGYHGVQGRWRHRFSSRVLNTFSPAALYTVSETATGPDERYAFTAQTFSLRDELDARLGPRLRLLAGIDLQAGHIDADLAAPSLPSNGITDPILPGRGARYQGGRDYFNTAVYLEAEYDPSPRLRALLGLRAEHFSQSNTAVLSPRGTVRLLVHPRVALRVGVGLYPSPARGYAVLPGFGNPSLAVERWTHGTLGVALELVAGLLELSLDVFQKRAHAVVAPAPEPLRFDNTGRAEVLGAEACLALRPGRGPFLGLVSYTLQRATRQRAPGAPWVPSTWDQPHLFTAVLGAQVGKGWELGFRVRYGSGSVEPFVTGALYVSDLDVALTFTDPTRYGRLPDFFSLDLRVSRRFRWGPVDLDLIAEVLNATNHGNVESRVYSPDRLSSVPVLGLPIVPSLGLRATY